MLRRGPAENLCAFSEWFFHYMPELSGVVVFDIKHRDLQASSAAGFGLKLAAITGHELGVVECDAPNGSAAGVRLEVDLGDDRGEH